MARGNAAEYPIWEGRNLTEQKTARRKKALLYLAAFLIPMGIMLAAYAHLGVHPFGGKTLLVVDMNNEYIDYYMQMNRVFREGGSYLRSWDMGMGLNMLGLVAYYTASPLNLLLILAPAACLTEAVLVVTLLKFGLCGLFFCIYVNHAFRRADLLALACGTAYALMGYNVAYSSNLMWLDAVYLLPLVLMGVEKILGEGKYLQYILSLIVVFFSNYYTGYMLGVFTFLYFTARFFMDSGDFREYLRKFFRFLGGAALAAGFCAALLLPAFLSLKSGMKSMWSIPLSAVGFGGPLAETLSKLLPGAFDTLQDAGLPNVYSTMAAVLGAVLFYLNKAVPLREKLILGGLTGFLLLSFSWGLLDIAWHAFEVPTWFPARYSFAFSFLLIYTALRGFVRPAGLTMPRILTATGLVILLVAEIAAHRFAHVGLPQVVLALFLTVSYGALCLAGSLNLRGKQALLLLVVMLLCAETYSAAANQLDVVDSKYTYRSRAGYYDYRETFLPAVEATEALDPGAYRIELTDARNANGGMALGYRGISHFSTTTDQTLNALLRKLGYNTGIITEVIFSRNTPLTNGLLGVKYLLSPEDPGEGYRLVSTQGPVGIYENTLAFPLAYFADDSALALNCATVNPFELQNDLVGRLVPGTKRVFLPLELEEEYPENLVPDHMGGGALSYYKPISGMPGSLEMTLHNPDGLVGYAFFPVYKRRFAKVEAFVDGVSQGREIAYRHNEPLQLGSDRRVIVTLQTDSQYTYLADRYFYGLDLEEGEEAAGTAREQEMTLTKFEDTAVEGIVTAPYDGILATSFPYDEGWTVKIDGEKAELQQLWGVFLAVRIPEGTHTVTMRYFPPGLLAGILISALSAVMLAALILWGRRQKKSAKTR